MAIPHSLALIEEEDVLCIADREHRRILCINAGLRKEEQFGEIVSVTNGAFVGRVFGISYAGNAWIFWSSDLGFTIRNFSREAFVCDKWSGLISSKHPRAND